MARVSAEVVNPVLALPGVKDRLAALSPNEREAVRGFLLALHADAHPKAEENWRRRKGPIAVYWRCVGVYAGHLARAIGTISREEKEARRLTRTA
jgi:hypothetical protein